MVMALSDEKTPEFDVVLKKTVNSVTTEVGLILCNGQGVHDPFAIAQEQQGRSAIKMATGDTKHSDYEPPYATDEVRDWSVGRGMDDADLEEGRFFDSKAAWTQNKARITMGPAWRFSKFDNIDEVGQMFEDEGDTDAYDNENTYNVMPLNSQATRHIYMIKQFLDVGNILSAGTYDIFLIIRGVGSPPAASVRVHTVDGSFQPNVIIGSTALGSYGTNGEWKLVRTRVVTDTNIAHGSYVSVSLICDSSPDADNYYELLSGPSTINKKTWYWNGSSYLETTDGAPYFRMAGKKPGDGHKTFFEMYQKVPYAVTTYDDDTVSPKVYRNGFFGRLTNAWNHASFLVGYMWDNLHTHVANEWVGWQLLIFDGRGSGEITAQYTITSNTTYEFVLDKKWDTIPNHGSMYAIVGGDEWYPVTGHGMGNGDRVTDVKTILGAMYIMRGDYQPAIRMMSPTLDDWSSDVGFVEMPDVKGTFIEYAQDSNNSERIWVATRDYVEKSATPPPKYNYFAQSDTGDLDLQQGDIVTNGDMELDSDWTSVGTPDVNERTQEFVKEQNYARKIVANADAQGITQTVTTTAGDYYKLEVSVLLPERADITNGDMELDSDWDDSGSPTTNERSIEQVHGGTYSRKIVADADEEGIEQAIPFIGLTANTWFEFIAWIYIDAGSANGMKIALDSTDIVAFSSTGAFTRIHGAFQVTSSSHTLKFLSDGGAATFFVDDVVSGPQNGVKIMMGGSELNNVPEKSSVTDYLVQPTWADITAYFKATSSSHTIQVLSDGGPSVFFVDAIRAIEAPTSLRAARSEKITSIISYGEPERLWVLTDAGLYQEGSGTLSRVPIDEMRNAADWRNGAVSVTYDVYLFFTFLNGGLERYYKSNLDDVGPDRDEGLPINQYLENRRGDIVAMAAYPTGLFLAIDAGDQNTYAQSSILFWNNTGYHEVWRGDDYQSRIRGLMIQPVQGDRADKLWFQYGQETMFLWIDKNPITNENMRFTYQSIVESPWIYRGKHDVEKYFDHVQLDTKRILDSNQAVIPVDVEIQYKVDDDDSWTSIGTFTSSPQDELDIGSHDVSGKRFKYRLIIETDNNTQTPIIEAITLDLIENVPVKDSWTFQFLMRDTAISKTGTPQNTRVEDVTTQLNTWRRSPVPVYMETVHSSYDGNWGPVVSFSTRPIKLDPQGQEEEMVGTITIIEA
jgi:hypothetical protein